VHAPFDHAKVYAPFDCVVVKRNAVAGMFVNVAGGKAEPLFVVVGLGGEPKKDGEPKLDFGVTPGHDFRVPVQDNRKEWGLSVQDDRKRPNLSGIQIVPETKKPDANQKKTDRSTPDATPGPGKKPVSYINVEVKGILNLPGASGDITTTIATKEGTLELEFLSGPGIPKIEGPRGADVRKLDGELVVVTGALRIESRPRGQAVVVRVASIKAAE
jgi:hypothetical protein